MSNIPVICFGPNTDTFYIGCGMRYYAQNMPPTISNTLKKLPAIQIKWMSMDWDGQGWAVRDAYNNTKIIGHINKGLEFVSFGANKSIWFAGVSTGNWHGNLEDKMILKLNEVRAISPNFDAALEGILFGKGTTMVFIGKQGFAYFTDEEAEGGKMESVLNEYIHRNPPWILMHGSSLCLYNIDYYFLKFKDPNSNNIEMRWNLPMPMFEKLAELKAQAARPESQLAIQQYESLNMVAATGRLNVAIATSNAVNSLNRWY
ncbi:hypothetical protein BDQ12DRAFT_670400 [Crucibulum laeve]|uniref:Uncharacterized protein n=1 Tax=Crucibulum laeve TaxID=68775 RepID=A0A5C3LWY5_9AGAR|nr:hypothetical protein BDQ12DRAFT_670400 [Crucibulum laeve]